ncbi:hypothetical protein Ga0466249_001203 [Sporomusaceae bacterium BoRhaA]|uniref:hypothetical protein n=1 Tax=Pelorhabdus rhamnosifermentans TaxID=2772457 RepID=UPI001C063E3E|nr:hypothetical protein [Pelorhabdus rhamnosifermentans]MBU2700111.1 hypothetical protein [Pelorhabdus rhamnosifermentans]
MFLSWFAMGKKDAIRSTCNPEQMAGLTEKEIDMLYLATLALSGHNTQPWTVFVLEPGHWIIGSNSSP